MVAPRAQSRHDISTQHPPARAATVVNHCVESAPKLGLRRQPHSDSGRRTSQDESPPACAVRYGHCEHSRVSFGRAGRAARPRREIRRGWESASPWVCSGFGWVADASHAASSDGPPIGFVRKHGQLGPEGSARRVIRWRTRPPARSCGVKLALENLVVLERNSATRVGLTGVVRATHGRGGRRHSGEGRSPR